MRFPALAQFADLALLLMRLLVAVVFISSGWSHAKDPVGRAKGIGLSPGFTRFLGIAELAGARRTAFGVLPQLAAAGLILVMLGAIQRKIFAWHTGFWGKSRYMWLADLFFARL